MPFVLRHRNTNGESFERVSERGKERGKACTVSGFMVEVDRV
jgi:hypothetical protein